MSGVGEAIAIVSCVAGIIQALDSGSKIVRQIKQRREAHRANGAEALPPSDILEETIEKGKQQIEEEVAKGNARFGEGFEEGDDTARLAMYQITIQIQNALLTRLTLARTDDGVIDFDECIDLSDQGCGDALVALRALYQRKLKDDMAKKREKNTQQETVAQPEQPQEVKQEPAVSPPKPELKQSVSAPAKPITQAQTTPMTPPTERKKSRVLGGLFSKPKTEEMQQLPTLLPSPRRAKTAPEPPAKLHRSSTMSSEASKRPSRLSVSSQSSYVSPVPSNERVVEALFTWSPGMSRASTIATAGPPGHDAAIANYGGCCKYAHLVRERGHKAGLGRRNVAMYSDICVYQCQSVKCQFSENAVKTKRGWEIDDRVYVHRGIQYRWMFLVKSHVPTDGLSKLKPYKCLICLMLRHDSTTYFGVDELFSHILQHREKKVGDAALEGPLRFSNQGVELDEHFDINLPEYESELEKPQPEHDTPQLVEEVEKQLGAFSIDRNSKTSSVVSNNTDSSSVTDPTFNPWSNPWPDLRS